MTTDTHAQIAQYYSLIDRILQHFAGEGFKEEVRRAKAEFFDNAGILEETSDQYEFRMSQFFDWYLFTRDLRGYSLTPLESVHMARELRFDADETARIEHLKSHRHGLFEFVKIKNDSDVYLKDLIKGDKLVVKKSPWTHGFEKDELFEARLIPHGDSYLFCKGFCFHPVDAKKFILNEVKRHKKDPDLNPEELYLRLMKMRYKFERYRHVKIEQIYSNESKVGL